MISHLQFVVLCSCADDQELFYFPYADANFGYQIFEGRSDPDQEPGRFKEDFETWPIRVSAREVASAIEEMIGERFLSWRGCLTEEERREPFRTSPISSEEMRVYVDYDCITFDDHIDCYGYGPHEFLITPRGVTEIQRPEYLAYDE